MYCLSRNLALLLLTSLSAPGGSVRGTVVSSGGEPLRKATVSLRAAGANPGPRGRMGAGGGFGGQSRTTDAAGAFVFDNVPAGNYSLIAERPGYVRSEYTGGGMAAKTITVTSEGQVTGISVRLTPQGVITGRVTDEDGDPLMHVSVQVIRDRWTNGQRQPVPLQADSTDDRGEFRLAGLMPGRYFIRVNASRPMERAGPRQTEEIGDLSYAPQFYPGVIEYSEAAPIQVAAGQEMRGVDFRLRKTPTWRVRGRVLDETGKPALFVTVMAIPPEGGSLGFRSMGTVRNADGSFEIAGLTPGSYALLVNRGGRDEVRLTARTTVQVGNRDVDNVVVNLQRTFGVSGTVRFEGEAVPAGSMRVLVEPLDSGMVMTGGRDSGLVKPDGTWETTGLSPGRYRFRPVSAPEGTYLKTVLAGGQDITQGAQISAAATGVEVVLGTKAPEVTGTVLNSDKQPAPGLTVVLIPERRELTWLYRTAVTDDSGGWAFRNLAPGQYTAVAVSQVEDGAWYDPNFLAGIEGPKTAIKLSEGRNETVQLTVAAR